MDEIMNESTKDILFRFVEGVLSFAESTANFAQEQIPDVIEQLVTFYFWMYTFYMSFCALLIVVAIIALYKTYNGYRSVVTGETKNNFFYCRDNFGGADANAPAIITILLVTCVLTICPLILLMNVPELIKIMVAPKVWLIEYAADLMNSRTM